MKINDFILELEKIKEKEGDLVVYIYPYFKDRAVSDIKHKVIKVIGAGHPPKSLLLEGIDW